MSKERGQRIRPKEFTALPLKNGDRVLFVRRTKPLPNPFLAGDMVRECIDTKIQSWDEFRRERFQANERGISGKDGD